VARHAHGGLAVEDVARSAPDIVVLDIEMPVMPVMDGLEALPLLLRAKPWVRVLMASTLTKRNAEISFRVLSLGRSITFRNPTPIGRSPRRLISARS
jgi:two-component system chemotaxis response regulator CheB